MFWPTVMVILTIAIGALLLWGKNKGLSFKLYEWLLFIAGVALFIFTLENIQGSFQENVPKAVLMFVLVTGIPSIILLAIPMIGVWRRGSSRT
ncbi:MULTISPECIES: hypothetical protein [Dehalococcoides]|jgi:hypothetical protein|uniref:Reductive dehalogenase anchoring protein n=3 Tax=Dehalococcoides mccartyi TaxID=61435 RepID=A0A916KLS9_DEHMC|nr:hypothetical protein [Dehalococcoides mccartyi]AGG05872.1 putative reductive dehalogenase anchoring protein [Dehalococcoides mccartyi DCMB5]AII60421.1 dehalogenase [Dehalococcoides mccartyi CG5]AIZ97102.1 putative anchoring protein KB1rdhB23 [Dehalococcoides mccartyi]AMU86064.1 reductive dehalogenase anchoring protein [Dehalococcoides mccartyi]AQX74143.1 reductive dehalogenase membrane anchor [Dehalococcoides mccartyi]